METSPRSSAAEGHQMDCEPSRSVYAHRQEAATSAVLERPDSARRKAVAVPRLVNWLEAQEPLRGDNVPQGLMSFLVAPERATRGGGAGPLAENPYRVGNPLLQPLAPQYSARRGEYRVLYLIEDEQVTIVITSVTHPADAYRTR